MGKIFKAVIYCRLSKEDGNKNESDSIANQRSFCLDYLNKQSDIVLVDTIVDDGVSGVSFNREGFRKIKELIQNRTIDCIIVRDLSRFSRNYIDAGMYLEKIFPSIGIRFIAINDNYDSLNSDKTSDYFILPFKNLINDSYAKDISVKIRSSLDVKRKNGEYVGAFCPYGYKRDEEIRHKLVIDENATPIIKRIFSMFKDGLSLKQIADKLNELGVLSPIDYKNSQGIMLETSFKSSSLAKWDYNTVKRILTNECYIGNLCQGKCGKVNYKVHAVQAKAKKDWIIIENSHEAIVSNSDFLAVNELLKRDTRLINADCENVLSGFVFCGDCGSSMIRKTRTVKGKKYIYYICSANKKNKSCSSHCTAQNIIEKTLLNSLQCLTALLKNEEIKLSNTDFYEFNIKNQTKKQSEEIAKYKKAKQRLYEDFQKGIIDEDEYFEFKKTYSNIINQKEISLVKLKELNNKQVKTWTSSFVKYRNFTALSRRVLMAFVDKILIYENNNHKIIYKFNSVFQREKSPIFSEYSPSFRGACLKKERYEPCETLTFLRRTGL